MVREARSVLYALPAREFTAARDARARELRSDGHRDAAAIVKALRKPSVTAWAMNQAVRARPDAAAALVEHATGAGRNRRSSFGATVDELVAAALDALRAGGSLGDLGSRRAELTSAFRTAPVSDDVDGFLAGTLAAPPEAGDASLEAALRASVVRRGTVDTKRRGPSRRARAPKADDSDDDAATAEDRAREQERARRSRKLRRDLDAAHAATRDADAAAREADRSVDSARRALQEAERRATDANAQAADAKEREVRLRAERDELTSGAAGD